MSNRPTNAPFTTTDSTRDGESAAGGGGPHAGTGTGRRWVLGLLPLAVGAADLALVHVGFLAAFVVRFSGRFPQENFEAYVRSAPGLTLLALVLFLTYGLYDLRPQSWRNAASGVVASTTLLVFFGMALSFVVRTFALPRSVFLISWIVHMLLLLGWRHTVWLLVRRVWGRETVLVVGPENEARKLARKLAAGGRGVYEVVGVVAAEPPENEAGWLEEIAAGAESGRGRYRRADCGPEERARPEAWEAPGMGGEVPPSPPGEDAQPLPAVRLGALPAVLETHPPDTLIITPSAPLEDKVRVVALCSQAQVRVVIIPGHRDLLVVDSRLAQVDDTLAFEVGPTGVPPHLAWAKRLMDIGLSALGLTLTLPLFPFIALAVKLSSPGPVFYAQRRVGLGGRTYTLWKFRTMREGAEDETGPVLSRHGDRRVTGVGRLLRRFRLDELPQLLNVLLGTMSLVGPRPERPEFVERYTEEIPYYSHRHLLKPGLTGLAQLYARYDTPVEEKLRYDLLYAKRYSLSLDFRLLFLTAKVLLKGEEAQWGEGA